MKPYEILNVLAKRSEELAINDGDGFDAETRVLVAASVELLKMYKRDIGAPDFDFNSNIDKAFLVLAVHRLDPTIELDEEERQAVAVLEAMGR